MARRWHALIVCAFFTANLACCVHPALPGGDAGELMACMVYPTVAHPPGYPLYLSVSHFVGRAIHAVAELAVSARLGSSVLRADAAPAMHVAEGGSQPPVGGQWLTEHVWRSSRRRSWIGLSALSVDAGEERTAESFAVPPWCWNATSVVYHAVALWFFLATCERLCRGLGTHVATQRRSTLQAVSRRGLHGVIACVAAAAAFGLEPVLRYGSTVEVFSFANMLLHALLFFYVRFEERTTTNAADGGARNDNNSVSRCAEATTRGGHASVLWRGALPIAVCVGLIGSHQQSTLAVALPIAVRVVWVLLVTRRVAAFHDDGSVFHVALATPAAWAACVVCTWLVAHVGLLIVLSAVHCSDAAAPSLAPLSCWAHGGMTMRVALAHAFRLAYGTLQLHVTGSPTGDATRGITAESMPSFPSRVVAYTEFVFRWSHAVGLMLFARATLIVAACGVVCGVLSMMKRKPDRLKDGPTSAAARRAESHHASTRGNLSLMRAAGATLIACILSHLVIFGSVCNIQPDASTIEAHVVERFNLPVIAIAAYIAVVISVTAVDFGMFADEDKTMIPFQPTRNSGSTNTTRTGFDAAAAMAVVPPLVVLGALLSFALSVPLPSALQHFADMTTADVADNVTVEPAAELSFSRLLLIPRPSHNPFILESLAVGTILSTLPADDSSTLSGFNRAFPRANDDDDDIALVVTSGDLHVSAIRYVQHVLRLLPRRVVHVDRQLSAYRYFRCNLLLVYGMALQHSAKAAGHQRWRDDCELDTRRMDEPRRTATTEEEGRPASLEAGRSPLDLGALPLPSVIDIITSALSASSEPPYASNVGKKKDRRQWRFFVQEMPDIAVEKREWQQAGYVTVHKGWLYELEGEMSSAAASGKRGRRRAATTILRGMDRAASCDVVRRAAPNRLVTVVRGSLVGVPSLPSFVQAERLAAEKTWCAISKSNTQPSLGVRTSFEKVTVESSSSSRMEGSATAASATTGRTAWEAAAAAQWCIGRRAALLRLASTVQECAGDVPPDRMAATYVALRERVVDEFGGDPTKITAGPASSSTVDAMRAMVLPFVQMLDATIKALVR